MENTAATVKLDHPIKIDGQVVKEIKMRRPTVQDLIAQDKFEGVETERAIAMLGRLASINPEDLGQMDAADYVKLDKAYVGFLKASPEADG
jgi:deoxycytidine triphosphate deaminase